MAGSKVRWSMPIVLAMCLIVLYELEESISTPPLVRLLEDAICRQHYAKMVPSRNDIDEAMCKTVPIQSDLAFVRGWLGPFRTAPGKYAPLHKSCLAEHFMKRSFSDPSSATWPIDTVVVQFTLCPC